jgi:hypothetical protein
MKADVPGALIRLAAVPEVSWLPTGRSGGKLSLATIHRWAANGLRGVKLRTVPAGGVLCTTEAWLLEFFEQLGEARSGEHNVSPSRTPTQRRREQVQADLVLERAGI